MKKAQSYRSPDRTAGQLASRTSPLAQPDVDTDDDATGSAVHARDIPLWQRDSISLSTRARRLLDRVRPALIRVLTFWDHSVTRLAVDERTLVVDSSGSYRIDV